MRTLITELRENPNNPRIITDENLQKLVDSLLVFPRMLDLRKIVVSKGEHVLLGGNMRHRALSMIYEMAQEELNARIEAQAQRRKKNEGETDALKAYWDGWRQEPIIEVEEADLTPEEEREFIIKDNVSAGTWNYDMLQNFDQEDLKEWGVTDWVNTPFFEATAEEPAQGGGCNERSRLIITFPREFAEKVYEMIGRKPDCGKTSFRLEELI